MQYTAWGASTSSWSASARYAPVASAAAALVLAAMPPFSILVYTMRGSCAARARAVSPTSGWAASLASASTSCQLGAVWFCTLSRNSFKNRGGVLYSGVKMLMVGNPAVSAARWAASTCLEGR